MSVRSVNQIELIAIFPYPSDVQIARTEVDVIGTHTKARRIQPEPVVRVDVIPIVKPLTSPEGNLRSTFEDILHFHERFSHAYAEIGCRAIETGTARRQERLVENAVGEEVWRHSERDIRHVRAVTENVILHPGWLHIEVVFVTKTKTAARVIRYLKVKGTGAAIAVKHKAGTDVHGKLEIAGERLQEGLVQNGSWSLAWSLCTIRIAQDTGIQDRTTAGIRLERLHLGFHGLDALLILSLHLIHLRL